MDGLEFGKWLLLLLNGATIAALLGAAAQELATTLLCKSCKLVMSLVSIGRKLQERAPTSTELELGKGLERLLSSSSGSSEEDESDDERA